MFDLSLWLFVCIFCVPPIIPDECAPALLPHRGLVAPQWRGHSDHLLSANCPAAPQDAGELATSNHSMLNLAEPPLCYILCICIYTVHIGLGLYIGTYTVCSRVGSSYNQAATLVFPSESCFCLWEQISQNKVVLWWSSQFELISLSFTFQQVTSHSKVWPSTGPPW